jgi:hypothetical protein
MKKTSLSIRVIYWMTQVVFWLFSSVGIFVLFFAFILFFMPKDINQTAVGIPVSLNVIETGALSLHQQEIPVQFVKMIGRIQFGGSNDFLGRVYGASMIIIYFLFFFIVYTFRRFITNVYWGKYFDMSNIALLKRISYALTGFWIFTVMYSYFQYFYIVKNLKFNTIEFTNNVELFPEILLIALFIWVLSHIFMKGVQLQEENSLTV